MRLKQIWTRPVIRRLDIDDQDRLTPEQRDAVKVLLKRKDRKLAPVEV